MIFDDLPAIWNWYGSVPEEVQNSGEVLPATVDEHPTVLILDNLKWVNTSVVVVSGVYQRFGCEGGGECRCKP